jgi:hypothetical protein
MVSGVLRVGTLDAMHAGMEPLDASADLFEHLWLLRRCYEMRSAYDRRSMLSIDETIDYGERLMTWIWIHESWDRGGLPRAA